MGSLAWTMPAKRSQSVGGLAEQQIVLVGQGPPDVPVRSQPGHDVLQVAVILARAHRGEAPAVVGVEQDQVRLDAELLQLPDPVFQVPVELRVGPVIVEAGSERSFEGVELRFVLVEQVGLRKNAHAHLVERPGGERVQGLLLQRVALVRPRVGRSADGQVRGAVLVGEVEGLGHPDHALRPGSRLAGRERAGDAVQRARVAGGGERPLPRLRHQQPHPVHAVAVVETRHTERVAVTEK